jgi:7-carboxy-7-deazaguanine synthase
MNKRLPVLEIFGPTFQGEGMVIGKKTMFVRTAGCDYSCSWCDSAFTWDGSAKEDIEKITPDEIWNRLNEEAEGNFSHVTISGGNPALLKHMGAFIDLLHANKVEAALETQGSLWQEWFLEVDDLTISPKPPSSLMKTNFQVLDDIIHRLTEAGKTQQVSLKVVIFNEEDFEYARNIHQRYSHIPFYLQVGNEDTGEDKNREDLVPRLLSRYESLVDWTMKDPAMNSARVLPQLHTLVWGNARGV